MENNSPLDNIKTEPAVVEEPKMEIETKPAAPVKEKRTDKEKSRKKDDRSTEQILRNLSGLETPEEKLSAMCKKYIEILDENRKLQTTLKQTEKKVQMIQREKDQCQAEKSKAVLARSRLESLCRELQRQNKVVKEESILKIREEEEKRKEVSAKFQTTLAEITALMAETNEKNVKLHEDNIEIHKKFKSVFDEMDIREQHFEGMHQMMKHELQVAEAKLAKVTLEMTEDKNALLKEKNTLLLKLTECKTKIHELQQVEANLRSQINMYTDKYDEFQNALTKSNEVFGGFNEEMEKMSKKILKLEKETNSWKLRWEKSQAALLDMATHKQSKETEIAKLNKKSLRLQELCRAMQQERTVLLSQLKEKSGGATLESNEEIKSENGQNLKIALDNLKSQFEKHAKILKTEPTTCSITEVIETNKSESSRDNQDLSKDSKSDEKNENKGNTENVSNKTVHSENKNIVIETVPVKTERNQSIINKTNEVAEQENSLESNKGIQIALVPVEEKSATLTETAKLNSEKPLDPPEIQDKEEINDSVTNTSNAVELNNESQLNNSTENHLQDSVISEVKDAPKIENSTENIITNGEINSNTVTNKKHKDGKKKKK